MKCETCGMQRGEHDRACVKEQLHAQKVVIIKKLAVLKKAYKDDQFMSRIVKSTLNMAIEIIQEA